MVKQNVFFRIVEEKCIDCGICREVCPYTAVYIKPIPLRISFVVDEARCTGCGGEDHAMCVRFCPAPGALQELVRVA
ncbi:MAG: 4Fe-4S binding protein [Acidobacteriota bacterium]|nr:4Fe-4S binding protein [Blastocatellia bacterium]MDW8240349.1 4Fe-4S binding protein [Acidobacteriota bacterium]